MAHQAIEGESSSAAHTKRILALGMQLTRDDNQTCAA